MGWLLLALGTIGLFFTLVGIIRLIQQEAHKKGYNDRKDEEE